MNQKRYISVVLSIFGLFNSFVYSKGKKSETLVSKQDNKQKTLTNLQKNNKGSYVLKRFLTSIPTFFALLEAAHIFKQNKNMEVQNRQLKDEIKKVEDKEKEIEAKDEEIKSKEILIKNLQKGVCPKLDKKYKFSRQLGHGEFGSTALFYENNNPLVIKTMFKSEMVGGKLLNKKGLEKEKEAVELFKSKPKNEHIVFPIDYFEDENFLLLIYPFVTDAKIWLEDGKYYVYERSAPHLQEFDQLLSLYDYCFENWNDITKKKCLWHLTKQWFEIFKYFCENKFCHMDIIPNSLVQINGTMCENRKFNYDDFTIKLIDWGVWENINWDQNEPVTSEQFKQIYKEKLRHILYDLYKCFKFEIIPHKKKDDSNCNSPYCCGCAFFQELDAYIGVPNDDNCICSSIYKVPNKTVAKKFDELINFCQQKIGHC